MKTEQISAGMDRLATGRSGAHLNAKLYREWRHKVKCHDDLLEACKAFVALAENDTIMVKNEGREPLMHALTLANEAITKATTPGDTKE